jgi:hypothetical protein
MKHKGIRRLGAVNSFEFEIRGTRVEKELGQTCGESSEGPIIVKIDKPVELSVLWDGKAPQKILETERI